MEERSGDLLARWRQGDEDAAVALFRRYAGRLVALARSRVNPKLAHRIDPEDVVQSVYRTFFADAREGRFALERGGDLWCLLVQMTLHKVHHQVARLTAQKRAAGREQTFGSEDSLAGLGAAAGAPSPLEAVILADELEHVLAGLEPLHRRIFELRLQGYNLDEIAAATERSQRTVCRVLDRIKEHLRAWANGATGPERGDPSP